MTWVLAVEHTVSLQLVFSRAAQMLVCSKPVSQRVFIIWWCSIQCGPFKWVKKKKIYIYIVQWTLRPSRPMKSESTPMLEQTLLSSLTILIYRHPQKQPWQKFNSKHVSSHARQRILHPSHVPITTKAADIRASEPVSLGAREPAISQRGKVHSVFRRQVFPTTARLYRKE